METAHAFGRGRSMAIKLLVTTALSTAALAMPAFAQDEQRAMRAFGNSRYTYCDAKLVGRLWRMDPGQGKVQIGQKILNGIGNNVPVILAESRRAGHKCGWEDTGLGYEDAERLARVWGLGTPYQAKLKAASLYTQGNSRMVTRMLRRN